MNLLRRIADRVRYGQRPPATSLADEVDTLDPQPLGDMPEGDPIGAQGDKQSGAATIARSGASKHPGPGGPS